MLAILPLPALAEEVIHCDLTEVGGSETRALSLTMDPAHYAPPLSADDPPRQGLAWVALDGRAPFAADPIWFDAGARRGFYQDNDLRGSRFFLGEPGGRGRLTERPSGQTFEGPCTEPRPQ